MAAKKPTKQKPKPDKKRVTSSAVEKRSDKSAKAKPVKIPKSILTLRPTPEEIKLLNSLKEATGLKTSSGALFHAAKYYVIEKPQLQKENAELSKHVENAENFVTDLRGLLHDRESINKQIDDMLKEKGKGVKISSSIKTKEVKCIFCQSTDVEQIDDKNYSCNDCFEDFRI